MNQNMPENFLKEEAFLKIYNSPCLLDLQSLRSAFNRILYNGMRRKMIPITE